MPPPCPAQLPSPWRFQAHGLSGVLCANFGSLQFPDGLFSTPRTCAPGLLTDRSVTTLCRGMWFGPNPLHPLLWPLWPGQSWPSVLGATPMKRQRRCCLVENAKGGENCIVGKREGGSGLQPPSPGPTHSAAGGTLHLPPLLPPQTYLSREVALAWPVLLSRRAGACSLTRAAPGALAVSGGTWRGAGRPGLAV